MRIAPVVNLAADQKSLLTKAAKGTSVSVRFSQRAQIVLLDRTRGRTSNAGKLKTIRKLAGWRQRFIQLRIDGLKNAPRPGRKKKLSPQKIQSIVKQTLEQKPANATHWSARTMAKAVGISERAVRRIWKAHGRKPEMSRYLSYQ